MNILLLGSGGREHAIAWKLMQSPRCDELFIAPGNPGTARCGTNVPIEPLDFSAIRKFIGERNISMLVPGPEAPLVAGIADFFAGDEVMVIGPTERGAMLEGSKEFAKAFMSRHGIPTAPYRTFTAQNADEAVEHIENSRLPVVLKADGLAAGKGVLICHSHLEARTEFTEIIQGKFGSAGATVVVEQFLAGREVSVFVLTDGEHFAILPPAKDYKRLRDQDGGPNTGGMGAVSPVPYADDRFMAKVRSLIVEPVIKGLREDGIDYRGLLYCGLMEVGGDPFVIEFNCRFGDPETQAVLPRLQSDLVECFEAVATGTLDQVRISATEEACCTVVMASRGYPGVFEKGKVIHGLGNASRELVFHAGTRQINGDIVTSGGRVLAVTALGQTPDEAIQAAYRIVSAIDFEGKYNRSDIGTDIRGQ
jgi:phosphoribosylamine--glycine ligase